MMPNLKLAFRTLFKSPFVTIVAALSLSLGIGANAAIFSLFNEMLMQPLPVPHPERLVNVAAPGVKSGSTSCNQSGNCDVILSYPMFRDLERQQTVFTGLAAHRLFNTNLAFRGQTVNAEAAMVSGSYFPTLGLRPAAGRLLTPDDDKIVGANFVAVLSYRFWTQTLGSDASVINQTMTVNGSPMTIVGIAPEGFDGTTVGSRPKIYVPISMRGQMNAGFKGFENRRSYWIYAFARLKPGVSIDQARAAMNTLYRPIIESVEAPLQKGMSAPTLDRFRKKQLVLTDGRRGQSSVQREARVPLLLLLAVTGIVLLIACANIANLLLARAANRAMEMAVRLSLGATRRQLLAQLLTESVLLALIGGVASLVVARWTLAAMTALLPAQVTSTLDFTLNTGAVLFAGAMSIGTGLLFGIFPALHSTRPELVSTLRSGAGNLSGTKSASRFRTILVTTQIALSTAMLICAGLFIKSLNNVSHVDLGLTLDKVSTFTISPALSGYDSARSMSLYNRLEEALRATPGVTGVTTSLVPILSGSNWGTDVAVQGFKKGPDTESNSRFNEIGTSYFATMGQRLLAGREFTLADAKGAPKVAIINEAFARKFGLMKPGDSPAVVVGKLMGYDAGDTLDAQIVGIVRDAKYSQVKDSIPALFFTPYRQDTNIGTISFYVRSSLPPEQMLPTIPKVVRKLDASLPLESFKTMDQQVRDNIFLDRMISTLSASFALLATLLASVGLYGVLAYSVAQRTNEIGIRVALGADSMRVRLMVLRQVGMMTLTGGLVGVVAAIGMGRAARSLLFEIKGYDPFVLVASALLLALVSLAAGYLPAQRASKIDPIRALRYE
jgi:predicted permease